MQPCAADNPSSVSLAQYLTLAFLGLVFVPIAIFTFLLMIHAGSARWSFPLAGAILWPFACSAFLPRSWRYAAPGLVFSLALTALLLTGFASDVSYDGLAYHSDAIFALLRGDNPYYGGLTGNDQGFDFWTLHYPKASWYFSALIIHATGFFQAGKVYHFLLLFAVFFYACAFCRRRALGKIKSWLIAAAVALGPVQMSQIWTYYVDGALGSLFSLLLFSTLNVLNQPRKADGLVFWFAGLLLVNLKFTGVAYALVIMAGCGVWLLWQWLFQKKREAFKQGATGIACCALLLIMGVPVMGFDPYVTNTIVEGNPLYPLAGAHKHDVITKLMPPLFRDESPLIRLAQAVFCRGVFTSNVNLAPIWKWPFTFNREDIAQFKEPDVKISGWGVLFGGLLISAMALYISTRGWRNAEHTLAIAIVLACAAINPHAWWARFAPQLALIPVFLIMPALQSKNSWAGVIAAGCLLNSLLVLWPNTAYYHNQQERIDAQVSHILTACGTGAYTVYGDTPFHYEQFLETNGIMRQGTINGPQPPKGALPFREIFLYKAGCG